MQLNVGFFDKQIYLNLIMLTVCPTSTSHAWGTVEIPHWWWRCISQTDQVRIVFFL